MNKSLPLHAIWLAIAAAAFLFGRVSVNSSSDRDDLSARNGSKSNPGSGRALSGSNGESGPNNRPAGRSGSSRTGNSAGSGVTVSQFLRESDALVANKMFADLLLELDPANAREIFEALRESGREGGEFAQQMGLFLQAWGKIDGASAISAVAELEGDGRRRGYAGLAVMRGWAATDPESAKAHLATLENGWERGFYQYGIVSGLASASPAAATEFVLEMDAQQRAKEEASGDEGKQRSERERSYTFDRQMDLIANAQIARGLSEATTWVENLPDGAVKSSAFDRVAEDFAKKDPAAAADWIKSHAEHEYAERGVGEVAEELSREDPAAAVAWLSELPESAQERSIHQSMERWARKDPVAAGEYLGAMPESPIRDNAVRSFARELDGSEPRIAAQWAGTIKDERIRAETLHSVARSWLRSQPDEAQTWLPESGLSPEHQAEIIQDATRDRNRGGRSGRERGR